MSEAAIMARLAALEARVAELESGSSASPGTSSSSDEVRREKPIDDHQLDNVWADKKIAKDPNGWKGTSQVGKTWSRAPVEWLEKMARSKEYSAHMERQKPDDDDSKWMKDRDTGEFKLKNGKRVAWHEGNAFDAKILRGWIERKKRAAPAPAKQQAADDFDFGANDGASADDGGIGF